MLAFFRVVLIIILVYYGLKYLFRFLAKRFMRKMQDRMNQQQGGYKEETRKEGDVKVDYSQDKKSNNSKNNQGEYVDFEEIED